MSFITPSKSLFENDKELSSHA